MRSVRENVVVVEVAGGDEDVAEVLTMEAEGEGIIVIVAVLVADFLVHLPLVVVHHLLLHLMPAALALRLQSVGRPQDEIYPLPVILGPDLHARVGVLVPEALLPISLVAVPPAHQPLPLAAAAVPLPSILAGLARLPLQELGVDDHPATPSPHLDDTFFLERIEQETAGAPLHGDADIRVLIHDHRVVLVPPLNTLVADAVQAPAQVAATSAIAIPALAPAPPLTVRISRSATDMTRREIGVI